MVQKKEINAKYVVPESEHSVMSICAGASAAGARTFTASSSQGIVFMEEVLWMVPGLRLPVVMCTCNRSISFPGLVRSTHSDSLLQRDCGWIQLYCETSQEALDTCVQAYKIAEHEDVYLPVMVCQDSFTLTHTATPVSIPDQVAVDRFLPPYRHKYVQLDPDFPQEIVLGIPAEAETEYRYQMEEAMANAKKVIQDVDREYAETFGRSYGGLLEKYQCEDAKVVLVTMGSLTGTARVAVDKLRAAGEHVGLIKLRAFRPFPTEEIKDAAKNVDAIGFVDRNFSLGSAGGGIGYIETARALYGMKNRPQLVNFIAGLGGRDVQPRRFEHMAMKLLDACRTGYVEREVEWVQLRV
jgi:pyruvate ferredoxin oxidoreductase alpha subunit